MARDLTAGMVTEVTAASLTPIFLMELIVDSGTIRFWNGIGDISWNSVTWTGSANFITFSEITETQGIEVNGVQFILNGINSSLISLVLDNANELQRGTVNLYMAALDSSDTVISDPIKIFAGNVDSAEMQDAGTSASITLNVESKLIALKRNKVRRYTPEDQKSEYADDKFFDFVVSLQDKELQWGKGS